MAVPNIVNYFAKSRDSICFDEVTFNANNVAERLRKMSIRFSLVVHTYNVLSLSWD